MKKIKPLSSGQANSSKDLGEKHNVSSDDERAKSTNNPVNDLVDGMDNVGDFFDAIMGPIDPISLVTQNMMEAAVLNETKNIESDTRSTTSITTSSDEHEYRTHEQRAHKQRSGIEADVADELDDYSPQNKFTMHRKKL